MGPCIQDQLRWEWKSILLQAGGPPTNAEKHPLCWQQAWQVAQHLFRVLPPPPKSTAPLGPLMGTNGKLLGNFLVGEIWAEQVALNDRSFLPSILNPQIFPRCYKCVFLSPSECHILGIEQVQISPTDPDCLISPGLTGTHSHSRQLPGSCWVSLASLGVLGEAETSRFDAVFQSLVPCLMASTER